MTSTSSYLTASPRRLAQVKARPGFRSVAGYTCLRALLVRAGHSPAKAAEIVLDASRRDGHALSWIGVLFSQRRA